MYCWRHWQLTEKTDQVVLSLQYDARRMSFYSTIWLYVTEFSFHHIPPQYVVPLVVLEQSNNMMQYLIHSSVNEHIDLFFWPFCSFVLSCNMNWIRIFLVIQNYPKTMTNSLVRYLLCIIETDVWQREIMNEFFITLSN